MDRATNNSISKVYTSEAWLAFMEEYIHLLEDDAPLYLAHEIPERGQMGREEFADTVGESTSDAKVAG